MMYSALNNYVASVTKGSFHTITYKKDIPVLKNFKNQYKVRKVSKAIVRFGVTYDNIGNVIQKRADRVLPAQNAGLSWGKWKIPGYFIEHFENIYLRCALVNGNPIKEQYFINDKPVPEDVVRGICSKSYFSDKSKTDVLTINIDNIISVE